LCSCSVFMNSYEVLCVQSALYRGLKKNKMAGGMFLSELSACRWQRRALRGRCFASFSERQENIPFRGENWN
jgi:hypothetical protein